MLQPEIFKANDIRGVVSGPDQQWDTAGAEALGSAFVQTLELAGKSLVLGRDTRHYGAELSSAFAGGAIRAGANVINVGLVSTDELWFISGDLKLPGVQFTASHNPPEYNGVKFCLAGAAPISPQLLLQIQELASAPLVNDVQPGTLTYRDMLADYAKYLLSLVDLSELPKLKVVVDAGNGMAGLTTPAVLGPLNIEIIGMFLDLDADFPNHPPNPLDPKNLVAAQTAVRDFGADLGLVFDGDADRCFIIDDQGLVVDPAIIIALVAKQVLAAEPGARIVVNTITSKLVADQVTALGGELVVSPVGHTHIKARMAEHKAAFGGEHSAHYYFREFWGADTGMLAALTVLSLLGKSGKSMSELAAELEGYFSSGEINTAVANQRQVMADVAAAFTGLGQVSWPDGLLINGDDWWVSVRASNTEPLLRLNVESGDESSMLDLRDQALAVIRKGK